MPTLSVALCTYQGARHLPEQLASLVAQERTPDEVVVVDDGSTDESLGLVEQMAATAPFAVRIEVNPRRLGAVRTFEVAMGACEGDLIAFCDQDDRWHPHKLARLEAALPGSEPSLAFSDGDLIDDDGRPRPLSLWEGVGFRGRRRTRFAEDPLPVLLNRSVVTGCASMFSVALRAVASPFPEALHDERSPMLHDRWLALVAALVGDVRAVPEHLLAYRVHPAQVTGIRRRRAHAHLPGLVVEEARRPVAEVAGAAAAHLAQLRALAERARQAGAPARRVAEVERACRHLEARAALPTSRRRRVGAVVAGLARGDYARYGSGPVSGAVDLVRPGPGATP